MPVVSRITRLVNNCSVITFVPGEAVIDRAHIPRVPEPESCPRSHVSLSTCTTALERTSIENRKIALIESAFSYLRSYVLFTLSLSLPFCSNFGGRSIQDAGAFICSVDFSTADPPWIIPLTSALQNLKGGGGVGGEVVVCRKAKLLRVTLDASITFAGKWHNSQINISQKEKTQLLTKKGERERSGRKMALRKVSLPRRAFKNHSEGGEWFRVLIVGFVNCEADTYFLLQFKSPSLFPGHWHRAQTHYLHRSRWAPEWRQGRSNNDI